MAMSKIRLNEISNNLNVFLSAGLCAMIDEEMFVFLLGRHSFKWIPEIDQLFNFRYITKRNYMLQPG